MLSSRFVRPALGLGAASVALLVGSAAPSEAASGCRHVRGFYVEHATSENCTSPVALCIAGTYSGQIRGDFRGAATSITTTADTPTTGAATFTSDSTIDATVGGRMGSLVIKNAGVFTAVGPIVDLQTIMSGTGELAGATGALRAQGTFSALEGGRSEYEGVICLS
jgi:hypothetical protein